VLSEPVSSSMPIPSGHRPQPCTAEFTNTDFVTVTDGMSVTENAALGHRIKRTITNDFHICTG